VRISPYRPAWQGVIISREPLTLNTQQLDYWVTILSDNCWRYELAGETMPENWPNWGKFGTSRVLIATFPVYCGFLVETSSFSAYFF